MSHSSKAALAKASEISSNVIAIGYPPILREAIARGAKEVLVAPICDDPFLQAQSFGNAVEKYKPLILIGENLDGPFSGATLAGVLSIMYDLELSFDHKTEHSGAITVVKDDGIGAFGMDIRRIGGAFSVDVPDSKPIGDSSLQIIPKHNTETIKDQSPREIASTIARRLRRISG